MHQNLKQHKCLHNNPARFKIKLDAIYFHLKCAAILKIIYDHGLRTPNESFFHKKSQTFVPGQTIWENKFWGICGIFEQYISTHFGTVSPLSMLFINQPLFFHKLSLYIQIPNIYLECGFEFELQRIRDLAIVCL